MSKSSSRILNDIPQVKLINTWNLLKQMHKQQQSPMFNYYKKDAIGHTTYHCSWSYGFFCRLHLVSKPSSRIPSYAPNILIYQHRKLLDCHHLVFSIFSGPPSSTSWVLNDPSASFKPPMLPILPIQLPLHAPLPTATPHESASKLQWFRTTEPSLERCGMPQSISTKKEHLQHIRSKSLSISIS